jgi:cytochrome o ubiquinol oxidase subunit IV
MTFAEPTNGRDQADTAPGDQRIDSAEIAEGAKTYLIGLGLATLLTLASFFIASTTLVWAPSIPVALVVLAIAQMGVHLVFFLHITTGPDNVNNVMALAFGVLIVLLILTGSLWIMAHLNHNMAPMEAMQTEPESSPMESAATARGLVRPRTTTPVGAQASGVIQALDCDVKMQVKAGQVCAKIDPGPYQVIVDQKQAELAAAEAGLEKDKAELAATKASLDRDEARAKRSRRKAIAKLRQTLEKTQTRIESGETKIAELQAALQTAKTNLGDVDIVSPIDGIIIARNVQIGQRVAADSAAPPLFVVAEGGASIRIDAVVDAKDIGAVKPGEKAAFTVEKFPNRSFVGEVSEIRPSPQTEAPAAIYHVVISAPDPDLLLEPGMAATIRFNGE